MTAAMNSFGEPIKAHSETARSAVDIPWGNALVRGARGRLQHVRTKQAFKQLFTRGGNRYVFDERDNYCSLGVHRDSERFSSLRFAFQWLRSARSWRL